MNVYFTLLLGLLLLFGCKSEAPKPESGSLQQDTIPYVSIPVKPNNDINDGGMPIPKELRKPKPEITYNPDDISLSQSYQDTFFVSNPSELYAALGPDRVLMVKEGIYKLDKRILINYEHIKLQGLGKTTLLFTDPKLTSIMVYGSTSVWLSGFTLDIEYSASEVCHMDECMSGFITLRKSKDVILDEITMPNTPLSQFNTDDVDNVMIYKMNIENSFGFRIDLYNSDNIQFQFCSFKNLKTGDNAFGSYAPSRKSSRVYFDNVEISNVTAESGDESGPMIFGFSPVLYKCNIHSAPGINLGVKKEYIIKSKLDIGRRHY